MFPNATRDNVNLLLLKASAPEPVTRASSLSNPRNFEYASINLFFSLEAFGLRVAFETVPVKGTLSVLTPQNNLPSTISFTPGVPAN